MDHLAKERRNLVAMLMPGRGVKDRVSLPGLANAPYTCPSLLLSCCSSPEQAGGGRGEGGGGERERKGERRIGSGPLYALPALSSSLCRTKKYYDAPYLTLALLLRLRFLRRECAHARARARGREIARLSRETGSSLSSEIERSGLSAAGYLCALPPSLPPPLLRVPDRPSR